MNLLDEAVIIEIFGIRMYAFGVYVMIGALCSMAVIFVMSKAFRLKPGTAALTAFCSILFGLICSRLAFCLLNQELGHLTPVSAWLRVSGGGWSMTGLIGGVFLGGWISARVMKEKTGRIMDILSLAILPLIIAERIGESRMEYFDISRPRDSDLLKSSFLAVGEEEPCLATYYLAAAVCLILFFALLFTMNRSGSCGSLAIRFLILFGAASIILESLRYDFFLSISFVGLQQVAAALALALGVILAIRRSNRPKSVLAVAAVVSLPLMVGILIGLEFALDRTTWNKVLIYAGMILTVAVPAALGLKLLNSEKKGQEAA